MGKDRNDASEVNRAHPPRVGEDRHIVDIPGVQLFVHRFDEALDSAPLRSSRFTIEPSCGTSEDRHAVHEICIFREAN